MQSVLGRLEALEAPVIAAIEGVALGGGAEVSLACDMRIASEAARIAFKQVSLGIMVGWGGGQRLLRLVGRSKALRLLLACHPVMEILTRKPELPCRKLRKVADKHHGIFDVRS